MELKKAESIIHASTLDVFSTMLGTELKAGPGFQDPNPFHQSEITGLIGIAGEIAGYVSMHCNNQQGAEFTRRFIGIDDPNDIGNGEVRDAVGEIVNMIAGNVKTEYGGRIEIALPTVVMTPKPDMRVRGATGILTPFEDSTGTFHVELVVIEA